MWLVADNLQITKQYIQKALDNKDAETIQRLIIRCVENGADAIDINTGPLGKRADEKMEFFVNTVQKVTDLPLIIDTANPVAIEAGLKCCKNRAIINGFSLEPHKIEKILPLSNKFDTEIMGYLLTPEGQVPKTSSERIAIALEIHGKVLEAGIDEKKLIIDPVLVPLIWGDGKTQDLDVLEVIRLLPEVLGYDVKTVVGLSNLTAGGPGGSKGEIVESSFLAMLAASGLTMVLLNIASSHTVRTAKTINKLMEPGIFSWSDNF